MKAAQFIINIGAVIAYVIEAWGNLPHLNDRRTNWTKHLILSLTAVIGLALVIIYGCVVQKGLSTNDVGLIIVGCGNLLSLPQIILLSRLYSFRETGTKNIGKPLLFINKAAHLLIGLGILIKLFSA